MIDNLLHTDSRHTRVGGTGFIGIVIPMAHDPVHKFTDPFLLSLIGFLSEEAAKQGYEIAIRRVFDPGEGWLDEIVDSRRYDGLIVIGQSTQHEALQHVADRYPEMVVWGQKLEGQKYCSVGLDNLQGGKLATEHLLSLGRRSIRFMGPLNVPETDSRHQGYVAAMKASGIRPLTLGIVDAKFGYVNAFEAAKELLKSGEKFDGLFCASDVIAQAAVAALTDEGRRVPFDVAVVGFDDIPTARMVNPSLTTIRQDLAMAAHLMVNLLLRRMKGEPTASVEMPAKLVPRRSTLPSAPDDRPWRGVV